MKRDYHDKFSTGRTNILQKFFYSLILWFKYSDLPLSYSIGAGDCQLLESAERSEVRVELVTAVRKPADLIVQVVLLVNLGGGVPEGTVLQLLVREAHVVDHVGLHLLLAHTLDGEDLGLLSLGASEHSLGVSGGILDAPLEEKLGLPVVRELSVAILDRFALEVVAVLRERLGVGGSLDLKVGLVRHIYN